MNLTIEKEINGNIFKQMLIGGQALLHKNIEIVNNLNVFPVPDGDTGTNMKMTFDSGLNAIIENNSLSIDEIASLFAKGMLLGARGNSGVILSQIFKGISNGLKGKETVNVEMLKEAFKKGVEQSYKAVPKPVEGTILTVFREATENTSANVNNIEDYLNDFISEGEKSLNNTPNLLPILKEANVIDSGGAGLIYIFKGMLNKEENITFETKKEEPKTLKRITFNEKGLLDFYYCTEFLLQLQPIKINITDFKLNELIKKLENIGGDSIVAILDEDIVKVHVHIDRPGKVFEIAQEYGEFISLKVENMAIQHSETKTEKPKEHKNLSIISVCKDDGIKDLFLELGCDYCVDGGQSMNPSSDDFVKAFDAVNSDNIIVLPNNSNILLACKQAVELYSKANVYICETKTLGEGFSALSMYDPTDTVENILETFNTQKANAITIDITKSIRCAHLNDIDINEGDYIALAKKKVLSSNKCYLEVIKEALNEIYKDEYKNMITIFKGEDTKEEDENLITSIIKEINEDIEVYFLDTKQDIYNYILVLE